MSVGKVTFLGLGAMGSRMAANLIAADFRLSVWNRSAGGSQGIAALGAHVANTPREAAEAADIVISMVTNDKASSEVWGNKETGALGGMTAGAIAIESSTVTPEWIEQLAKLSGERGIQLLDAPVSGSLPQAESRQLVVMVGGEKAVYDKAEPVLSAVGSPHYIGGSGHGIIMKLAVNALLGVQIGAFAELLVFVQKNGLDVQRVFDVLATMPVASPTAAGVARLMLNKDFAPRFTNDLIAKDFTYFSDLAKRSGSTVPVSDAAREVFEKALSAGMGAENVSAIIRMYTQQSS
ncbi:NAD(P)-dependent oxidoreductase [Granulicella sp. dw_53]|uniref:NAD(P)-dependent oxidoreductase n=1 Tax=Granulicella sp. dw_53 TaxID=2719792 RepID=UPI001BD503B7|nr:NAD(P)-dependent oxidoreductase [Granulicella sp. dw_53]